MDLFPQEGASTEAELASAKLQVLQLQCIVEAKDREMQALRASLGGEEVDQEELERLRGEVQRLRHQRGTRQQHASTGEASGVGNGGGKDDGGGGGGGGAPAAAAAEWDSAMQLLQGLQASHMRALAVPQSQVPASGGDETPAAATPPLPPPPALAPVPLDTNPTSSSPAPPTAASSPPSKSDGAARAASLLRSLRGGPVLDLSISGSPFQALLPALTQFPDSCLAALFAPQQQQHVRYPDLRPGTAAATDPHASHLSALGSSPGPSPGIAAARGSFLDWQAANGSAPEEASLFASARPLLPLAPGPSLARVTSLPSQRSSPQTFLDWQGSEAGSPLPLLPSQGRMANGGDSTPAATATAAAAAAEGRAYPSTPPPPPQPPASEPVTAYSNGCADGALPPPLPRDSLGRVFLPLDPTAFGLLLRLLHTRLAMGPDAFDAAPPFAACAAAAAGTSGMGEGTAAAAAAGLKASWAVLLLVLGPFPAAWSDAAGAAAAAAMQLEPGEQHSGPARTAGGVRAEAAAGSMQQGPSQGSVYRMGNMYDIMARLAAT